MVSDVKKQMEEKTRIPKNQQQHLVSRGKVLKDTRKVENYNLIEEETIELTSSLLGATKREESRPVSKEREAKTKASEPCIDTGDREENKSTTAISEETVKKMMQKIEEATHSMKYRTDDLSSLEQSYSSLGMEMTAVKNAIERMSIAFSQMNEENQKRETKSSVKPSRRSMRISEPLIGRQKDKSQP